jgi:putative redox protein
MKATMIWKQGMNFECDNHGIKTAIDATPEAGGSGLHPTPKELVMNAMMGCTAIDVVSILKKMRQEIKSFTMENEVEKTTEHPVHFKTSLLTFNLEGDLDPEKVKKAVDSSLTKYCGVNFMISLSCAISYRIVLNGSEISTGKVSFAQKESV